MTTVSRLLFHERMILPVMASCPLSGTEAKTKTESKWLSWYPGSECDDLPTLGKKHKKNSAAFNFDGTQASLVINYKNAPVCKIWTSDVSKNEKAMSKYAVSQVDGSNLFFSKAQKMLAVYDIEKDQNPGWANLLGYYEIRAKKCYSKSPSQGNLPLNEQHYKKLITTRR